MRCLPLLLTLALAQVQAPPQEVARVLHVKYSDGRTTTRILNPRGGSWTPYFPHRPDAPDHEGLKLHSLQFDHVAERDTVTLTVSLNYGVPLQHRVPVGTVTLRNGQSARIEGLTPYGVDPITVSIGEASPAAVVQPSASSVSPSLEIAVETVAAGLAVYKVTLRNRGQVGVAAVDWRAYRGDVDALSGRRKTGRVTTLMAPGGIDEFRAEASPDMPGTIDRFEVTAVLWDDGSVEGDRSLKDSEQAVADGQADQLRRVVSLLSDGASSTIDALRSAFDRLPIDSQPGASGRNTPQEIGFPIGQRQVKTAVLQDLDEYSKGKADASAQAWIEGAKARYAEWLRNASK
jgi:hypothetical protein